MRTLGIDLGTTTTLAAADGLGICIGEGEERLLPSVVAFLPNGRVEVGSAARRRRAIDGPNVIFSSKRILGLRYDDSATQQFRERYPLELVRTADAQVAFRTRAGSFTPLEIAAMLLSRVHQRVLRVGGPTRVVVTVPVSFSEAQREATKTAAARADFGEAHLLEEPMATAHAYLARGREMHRVAVYDFGGGTFQLSVLECGAGELRILAHASDPFLGGDDIDHEIARWIATEVTKQANWDLTNFAGVRMRLLAEAERAKVALSSRKDVLVDLSQVDTECPLSSGGLRLRRPVLERLCEPLVRRSFATCDRALREAGLKPTDLDTLLFAGGSTQLPVIAESAAAYFGRAGVAEIDPTQVVAIGASSTHSQRSRNQA